MTPDEADPPLPVACEALTMVLKGHATTIAARANETIVEAARRAGLRPPVDCLQGACATCMARVAEGVVGMHWNDVLTDAEVAAGHVLTCVGYAATPTVTIVYED